MEDKNKALVKIGPGFWNSRASFKIVVGLIDIGTHLSVLELSNGKYLIVDPIPLTDDLKKEINELTDNGAKIEAVLCTHPYHTLYINAFRKVYSSVPYYGCPRHLKIFPDIPWAGDLNDCKVRSKWSPEVEMAIPAGAEFVAPEGLNHFSCVFVFHKASATLHVDDTIMYAQNPGWLLKLGGFKKGSMCFHTTFKGIGLLPAPEAPFQFRDFLLDIIKNWDFDNICTAHFGYKIGGAKAQLLQVVKDAEPMFQKLHEKRKSPNYKPEETETTTISGNECG